MKSEKERIFFTAIFVVQLHKTSQKVELIVGWLITKDHFFKG
jgi:hypothetical protein